MKLHQVFIDELTDTFLQSLPDREDMSITRDEVKNGVLAVLKVLDPIPYGIDKVRDEDGKLWRRVIHDDDAWITAVAAQIATSRRLVNEFNVTWEGKK